MKQWSAVAAVVFSVTLAYIVGVRLSESAMAVVVGVIFGVAASIPASLILLFALRRQATSRGAPSETPPQQPPTIIVAPPAPPQVPGYGWPPPGTYLPPMNDPGDPDVPQVPSPRRFRIVGDE